MTIPVGISFIKDFRGEITESNNIVISNDGIIKRIKGYTTFGQMVDELWKINERYKRQGFQGNYTITLPLKGTKPVYKRTLTKTP